MIETKTETTWDVVFPPDAMMVDATVDADETTTTMLASLSQPPTAATAAIEKAQREIRKLIENDGDLRG